VNSATHTQAIDKHVYGADLRAGAALGRHNGNGLFVCASYTIADGFGFVGVFGGGSFGFRL
jgi:hypothetical protein